MKRSFALDVRGSINFCPTNPTLPCGRYVYQGVLPGLGNVAGLPRKNLQLRRWVLPADPRTAPQLARRSVFFQAVAAWHALSATEKLSYRQLGESRRLPAYNKFISLYLKTH